jgi:hypothetical protein
VGLELGSGIPTVVVHALNFYARDWMTLANALVARDRRMLVRATRSRMCFRQPGELALSAHPATSNILSIAPSARNGPPRSRADARPVCAVRAHNHVR